MREYYNSGDCIDGKRVLIRFKKIQYQPNTYVMSPTGFKGTKYKCSRDGITEISVALPSEEAKKVSKLKPSVHLEVGDRLRSNRAYIIANTPRKLNCFNVTMMSGRHECNEGTPDVRVYAEIETSFEGISNAAQKKFLEMKNQMEIEGSKPQASLSKLNTNNV